MKPLRIGLLNFEPAVLMSELPVLLIFGAIWDRDSRQLYDLIPYISEKYDEKIVTGIVDYEYAPDIFTDYNIDTVPTMIFFEDGKPIMRETGYTGTMHIEEFVRKFYGVLPY